jgi:peptide/nickel transport system substrate-binding protein
MSANEWDITNWIGAATTMFGKDGTGAIREYAPFYPNDNPWGDYAIWYQSQGESGLEPPEEVKKLREMGELSLYGATEAERREAIDYLLKSQAENLWIIGTVSMGINPLIVSDKLRNVPEIGSWNWLQGFTLPYRPEQWFFSE